MKTQALAAAMHILLHVAVVLLVWGCARRWVGPDFRADACALLFAFHPVTAPAALWICAQSELLIAGALLGAALLLDQERPRSVLAAALFGFGLLAKESVIMAVPAVSAWLVWGRKVPVRKLAPLWAVCGAFVALRAFVVGGMRSGDADLVQVIHHAPILFADGLRGMVLARPVGLRHLSFEYDPLGWGWTVGSALLVLSVAALAWRARRTAPLGLVGVAVGGLMRAPVAVVTTVPGWGGYGRYLYVPLAFALFGILQAVRGRLWIPVAAVVLGVQLLGFRQAQVDWRSDEELGASQVRLRPDLGVGYAWLGQVDLDAGDCAAAVVHYQDAVVVDPDYHPAFQNLSVCLVRTGRPAEALSRIDQLEALHGTGPRSAFARSLALAALGRSEESADIATWALERAPSDPDLLWVIRSLLEHHPDRAAFEAWLESELLSSPERAAAREAILPLLSASLPASPPGSEPGTSAPVPRTGESP